MLSQVFFTLLPEIHPRFHSRVLLHIIEGTGCKALLSSFHLIGHIFIFLPDSKPVQAVLVVFFGLAKFCQCSSIKERYQRKKYINIM